MKKFMKVAGALALGSALFLGACVQTEDPPPPVDPAPGNGAEAPPPELPEIPDVDPIGDDEMAAILGSPATLRVAWWGGEARNEAVLEALSMFGDRYGSITIQPEFGAFQGFMQQLQTQLAGGVAPDIVQANYAWLHAFGAGNNVFYNLNELAHIIDLSEWSPEMLAFTTTADGQLAAVPHGLTGRLIVYNTEMLAEHGFDTFPATFDEWIELGTAVSAGNTAVDGGNNQYAFFPLGEESLDIMILTMLYNMTGHNLQANGQILFSVDDVEAVFNILAAMKESGALPTFEQQEAPHDHTNPVWTQARAGSIYEWVGNIFLAGGSFLDNDPPAGIVEGLGVALLPAVNEGGTRLAMQRPSLTHAIGPTTNYPEVAAYLLNFLYTDEDALMVIAHHFGVPFPRTAAAIAEREGQIWGLQLEGLDLLTANMAEMCPVFEDPTLRPFRFSAINAFRTGDIGPREAAERWVQDQQFGLDEME